MAQNDLNENTNPFPFQNLTNPEFTAINNENRFSQSDMDRLSQLRFNPFETNQNFALSDNNVELDLSFNTNIIQCDYYLPEEFKKRIENENIEETFSLLHLNIRSILNKFDSFKNLIDALNIPFQIIGRTETWLNDNNSWIVLQ